tara:strand:+ start:1539 stop:3464 length:1926 start_codon:yes stop_codon:yes gene_type:complete
MNEMQARIIAEAEAEAGITNEPVIGADGKPVPRAGFRAGLQGLSFGGSDEIEAAIRAVLPENLGGGEYTKIRDDLRKKLKDYQKAYPAEAIGAEIAGALLSGGALSMTGAGSVPAMANIARVANAAPKLARVAATAAGQSGLGALGYSEAENLSGKQLSDVGIGTAIGTSVGTGLTYAAGGAGTVARKLMEFTRRKFGDKADSAVQAELQRLQAMTGKSQDEVIQDIVDGRVMADNETLGLAIKGMVNEGGQGSVDILAASGARADQTGQAATQRLRETLTPDADDPNVVRTFRESDKDLSRQQSQAYDEVFDKGQVLPVQTADELLNVIQRVPETRVGLSRQYQAENLVPLFKELDNGAIEFARAPTLRDAEIVRRVLKDVQGAEFSAGRGQMGSTIGDLESGLRSQIDTASPDLGAVRASYAGKMAAREAFEEGRKKGLSMNVDELSYMMEGLNGEALEAFRAGVMDALNNKARRSGVMLRDLANEDKQVGAALRAVLPATRQADEALDAVSVAAAAKEQDRFIQQRAGSPTSGLESERVNRGSAPSAEDVLRGSQGDPFSIIRMIKGIMPESAGLNDSQIQQVAEVLYSESPELVQRALSDNTVQGQLVRRIESLLKGGLLATRSPAQQQSSQAATGN